MRSGKQRADSLIGFYRLARAQNLDRELISRLLVFLEWMVALPPGIESYYTERVTLLEEEAAMPYVTIFERRALERGLEKGREQGRAALLARLLQLKFGELSASTKQRLDLATEAELDSWAERILTAESINDVFG